MHLHICVGNGIINFTRAQSSFRKSAFSYGRRVLHFLFCFFVWAFTSYTFKPIGRDSFCSFLNTFFRWQARLFTERSSSRKNITLPAMLTYFSGQIYMIAISNLGRKLFFRPTLYLFLILSLSLFCFSSQQYFPSTLLKGSSQTSSIIRDPAKSDILLEHTHMSIANFQYMASQIVP